MRVGTILHVGSVCPILLRKYIALCRETGCDVVLASEESGVKGVNVDHVYFDEFHKFEDDEVSYKEESDSDKGKKPPPHDWKAQQIKYNKKWRRR